MSTDGTIGVARPEPNNDSPLNVEAARLWGNSKGETPIRMLRPSKIPKPSVLSLPYGAYAGVQGPGDLIIEVKIAHTTPRLPSYEPAQSHELNICTFYR